MVVVVVVVRISLNEEAQTPFLTLPARIRVRKEEENREEDFCKNLFRTTDEKDDDALIFSLFLLPFLLRVRCARHLSLLLLLFAFFKATKECRKCFFTKSPLLFFDGANRRQRIFSSRTFFLRTSTPLALLIQIR